MLHARIFAYFLSPKGLCPLASCDLRFDLQFGACVIKRLPWRGASHANAARHRIAGRIACHNAGHDASGYTPKLCKYALEPRSIPLQMLLWYHFALSAAFPANAYIILQSTLSTGGGHCKKAIGKVCSENRIPSFCVQVDNDTINTKNPRSLPRWSKRRTAISFRPDCQINSSVIIIIICTIDSAAAETWVCKDKKTRKKGYKCKSMYVCSFIQSDLLIIWLQVGY
jgi:hypothetical protein